jgi:hypothetical protein
VALCCICHRELGDVLLEEHHLVPRTFKGRDTVLIHKMCHQKIHATFSERELLQYYHTPERLREHTEMQKFIAWIRKKPLGFYDKNNDTNSRRRQR